MLLPSPCLVNYCSVLDVKIKPIIIIIKFLKYIQECPVKCLWLKSKIAQLSPTPIYILNGCYYRSP